MKLFHLFHFVVLLTLGLAISLEIVSMTALLIVVNTLIFATDTSEMKVICSWKKLFKLIGVAILLIGLSVGLSAQQVKMYEFDEYEMIVDYNDHMNSSYTGEYFVQRYEDCVVRYSPHFKSLSITVFGDAEYGSHTTYFKVEYVVKNAMYSDGEYFEGLLFGTESGALVHLAETEGYRDDVYVILK